MDAFRKFLTAALLALIAITASPVGAQTISGGLGAFGGQVAPYLGAIGTHVFPPNGTAGTIRQVNAETHHRIRANVTGVQIVWANWAAVSGHETSTGATQTITASVTDPATGVKVQLTFGGQAQGTIPAKGQIVSDVAFVRVKSGDDLVVRSYTTNTGGMLYNAVHGSSLDKLQYAVSGQTDLTMSASALTNTAPGSPFAYPPVAILGMITSPSACLAGDSITFASADAVTNATWDVGILGRSLGPAMGYINLGIPSDSLATALTAGEYTNRMALAAYCSDIIDAYGVNDIGGAAPAATVAGRRATFAALFPTKRVWGTTLTPRTTSSDAWVTLANQTVVATEAARVSFNALVRAGIAGEVGYFDVADATESDRDSGKWAVGTLPGAASGSALVDAAGLHPNPAGNERIQRSGVVRPAYLFPIKPISRTARCSTEACGYLGS